MEKKLLMRALNLEVQRPLNGNHLRWALLVQLMALLLFACQRWDFSCWKCEKFSLMMFAFSLRFHRNVNHSFHASRIDEFFEHFSFFFVYFWRAIPTLVQWINRLKLFQNSGENTNRGNGILSFGVRQLTANRFQFCTQFEIDRRDTNDWNER